jgi:hypothetical protein
MKSAEILVWDCATCESDSLDFIPQLQRYRKTTFAIIIVAARDIAKLPSSIGDLAVALPITTRFGESAISDSLVDAIGFFVQAKGNCSFVVVSNQLPLWITLFQRIEPKSVTFISAKDPKGFLEFSFLPEKIPVRMLAWPTLEELASSGPDESALSPSTIEEQGLTAEEEDLEMEDDTPEQQPPFVDEETPRKPHPPVIQPLKNMESHHIDLRSPISGSPPSHNSDSENVSVKKDAKQSSDQPIQVSMKFKALIEVMRSIGKVMVSIQDLEGQLKQYGTKTGEPIENPSAYIAKAGDAQILTIDKGINYVRFRNRNLATASIAYV